MIKKAKKLYPSALGKTELQKELNIRDEIYCLCEVALFEDIRIDSNKRCSDIAANGAFDRRQYNRIRNNPQNCTIGTLYKTYYALRVSPLEVATILDQIWQRLFNEKEDCGVDNPKLQITEENYPRLYKTVKEHSELLDGLCL